MSARVEEGTGRPAIGRVGVSSHQATLRGAAKTLEAVAEIEELGYGAIWIPEGPGFHEIFSTSALLLASTRRIVVATGIVAVYTRDSMAVDNGARTLAEAFPGRFVLGLGVGHPKDAVERGHSYGPPLSTMREFLDGMDAASFVAAPPAEPPPRVLAALGPKMLKLAAERTWGAHPTFPPVAHSAFAREIMGAGPLLAPAQPVVLTQDGDLARRLARKDLAGYFRLANIRNNLLRLGWSEDDLANGGSDAIVDSIVPWGDVEAIQTRVREHLDAGADHVAIRPLPAWAPEFPLPELRELAPALLEL